MRDASGANEPRRSPAGDLRESPVRPAGARRLLLFPLAALLALASFPLPGSAASPETDDPALARLDTLWRSGERREAMERVTALLDGTRSDPDTSFLVELLLRRGAYLTFFSSSHDADVDLREALALAEAVGTDLQQRRAVRWLGVVAGQLGRRDEAYGRYRQLLRMSTDAGDRALEGWAHVGIAWHIFREGRIAEALDEYDLAVACFREVGDLEGEVWARNGIGICLDDTGDYDGAIECYRATAQRARESGVPWVEAMAVNNIGRLEYLTGRVQSALAAFERAYEIHTELGNRREAVIPSTNIARCLLWLGRGDEALAMLERELDLCRAEGYRYQQGVILKNLALQHSVNGRPNEAIALCGEIDEMGEAVDLTLRVESRIILSDAVGLVRGDEAALAVLEEALPWTDAEGAYLQQLVLRCRIGERLASLGRHDEALAEHRFVMREAARRNLADQGIESTVGAADAYRALGRPDSAMVLFERAAVTWEAVRRLPLDPDWRENRGAAGRAIFTRMAAALLDDPSDLTAEERVETAFDRLQVFKARTLFERTRGPGRRMDEPEGPVDLRPVTLRAVRERVLREGELLLDFHLGRQGSFLFAVTRSDVRVVRLPAEKDLAPRIERYGDLIASPTRSEPELLDEAGAALSTLLFAEIEDRIAASRRVIVAPDGPMNLLPLVELASFGGGVAGPAGEVREFTRVPSATILEAVRDEAEGRGDDAPARLLAIASEGGDPDRPLAGAISEVRRLGRRYAGADVFLAGGDRPAPSAEELAAYDVLHVASHVRTDDRSPWQSEILLGPAGDEANPRASWIAGRRLSARLAVLSSCNSAGGRIVNGEGVLGLSSAFLGAGVPAVVATLWAVDDAATARLVDRFYEGLAAGDDAARSLRLAQLALRADPETRHPFYWAGFVLVGDGDVRVRLEKRRAGRLGAGAITALLLAALFAATLLLHRRETRRPS